jgi:hypothetical protein
VPEIAVPWGHIIVRAGSFWALEKADGNLSCLSELACALASVSRSRKTALSIFKRSAKLTASALTRGLGMEHRLRCAWEVGVVGMSEKRRALECR